MSQPENPPAFTYVIPDEWREVVQGMTLLDYFAAAALQGMLAGNRISNVTDAAHNSYAIAQAMLKERENHVK